LIGTFVVAEIGSNSESCEEFVRVETRALMELGDCLARGFHRGGTFPFDDGDDIEFTRAGGLFENGVLHEAGLRAEKFVGGANLFQELLAGGRRNAEFIDSKYLCIHGWSAFLFCCELRIL